LIERLGVVQGRPFGHTSASLKSKVFSLYLPEKYATFRLDKKPPLHRPLYSRWEKKPGLTYVKVGAELMATMGALVLNLGVDGPLVRLKDLA
jgi:hypothetical protein